MTQVRIIPLGEENLAELIATAPGEAITRDVVKIFDFCQKMSGEIWTGFVDDQIICAWGLIPPTMLSNQAYLWLWTTPGIQDHKFLLVRHSQRQISKMLDKWDTIHGHCRIDRPDSQRWLRWLGAIFGPPEGNFRPFTIRKNPTWSTQSLSA